MPEVLLTYESVAQGPDETETMEPELDEAVAEDQLVSDAEVHDSDGLQQDETAERPEDHVYNISHGDGQKHSGTIEQAMKDCPAMRGKSREEIRQIMDKRTAADRVVERMREKKRAEAAEKAKASTTEKTERTNNHEQAKERKAEQDTKAAQTADAPAKERPEGVSATAAKVPEIIIPDSARHISPEKPSKPITPDQNSDEHEPAAVPSKAHEDAGVGPIVELPRMDFGTSLVAELSARKDIRPTTESEVFQPPVDTVRVADRVEPGVENPQVVEPLDARPIEDAALRDSVRQAAALHIDTLAAESAGFGQDPGIADGEMAALNADELRQLFGIVIEHDADNAAQTDIAKTEASRADQPISTDATTEVANIATAANSTAELRQLFGISEHDVEEDTESVLDSEVMEIRQAFLAAGHAGGALLEDLVALDVELDEHVGDDEYAVLPVDSVSELDSEGTASPNLAFDVVETGEDAPASIILPEVRPEFLETNIDADSAVDARAPTEAAGALQEALRSLEPDQAAAVEDFLVNAARAVERLERINESDETERAPIEHELEILCAQLFDALGIDHSDELIRHFIDGIVSPETLTVVHDGALSSLDIALLNYLGTNEYKGDEQASLLKGIMQAVRDWLRHQRWLGRCALKLARDALPGGSIYGLASM